VALTLSATLASAQLVHGATTLTVSSLAGVDSNVFLSDANESAGQRPQTSMFVQTNLAGEWGTDSSRAHRFGWSFHGLSKHYVRFGEADKLFADSALAYRYAATPSLLFGVVQTFSYAKLQLLDTEGNTLPRDRFVAYSGEVRGYTQRLAARSRLTLGAGLRQKDISEVTAVDSIDHSGYFAYLEGVHRLHAVEIGLGYEYAVTHYDEVPALLPDSTLAPGNPLLTLVQHTARSHVAVRLARRARVSLEGQTRWTLDRFEDELSYRQFDVQPRGEVLLPFKLLWNGGAGYRARAYDERLVAPGVSPNRRRERFLQTDTSLRRRLTDHLSIVAQAQFIRKTSNAPGDEFRERIYALGVSLTF
jgi:hypothetical protein